MEGGKGVSLSTGETNSMIVSCKRLYLAKIGTQTAQNHSLGKQLKDPIPEQIVQRSVISVCGKQSKHCVYAGDSMPEYGDTVEPRLMAILECKVFAFFIELSERM